MQLANVVPIFVAFLDDRLLQSFDIDNFLKLKQLLQSYQAVCRMVGWERKQLRYLIVDEVPIDANLFFSLIVVLLLDWQDGIPERIVFITGVHTLNPLFGQFPLTHVNRGMDCKVCNLLLLVVADLSTGIQNQLPVSHLVKTLNLRDHGVLGAVSQPIVLLYRLFVSL